MSQPRLSPRANSDLLEIWSYISEDSETNADSFIDKLYETIHLLGQQPGSGRRRDELALGMRSFAFGRYVIFYRTVDDVIEIARILHGARDIPNILESNE